MNRWTITAVALGAAAGVGIGWGYTHAPRHPDQIDMISDPDVHVPADLTDQPTGRPVHVDPRRSTAIRRTPVRLERPARPSVRPVEASTAAGLPPTKGHPVSTADTRTAGDSEPVVPPRWHQTTETVDTITQPSDIPTPSDLPTPEPSPSTPSSLPTPEPTPSTPAVQEPTP